MKNPGLTNFTTTMTRAKLQIKKPGGPNRDEKNSVKTYDDREKKTSRQDFQGIGNFK